MQPNRAGGYTMVDLVTSGASMAKTLIAGLVLLAVSLLVITAVHPAGEDLVFTALWLVVLLIIGAGGWRKRCGCPVADSTWPASRTCCCAAHRPAHKELSHMCGLGTRAMSASCRTWWLRMAIYGRA